MKKLIHILSILCILSYYSNAQDYHIIHIKGVIKLAKTKQAIKVGDKLNANDRLIFQNSDAMAAVISSEKGRFILKAQPDSENNSSEIMAYVNAVIFPAQGKLNSRGMGLNNIIDLQNHFLAERYLVLGTTKLKISKKAFPMSERQFFYVRSIYEGENINKKLNFNDDTLFLDKKTICATDTEMIDPKKTRYKDMLLFYYNAVTQESTLVCAFKPVFPDETKVKEEVSVLIETLKQTDASESYITDDVYAFLHEFYGKPDRYNLSEWLKENFELK